MSTDKHKQNFWYKMRFFRNISYIRSDKFQKDNQLNELNLKWIK